MGYGLVDAGQTAKRNAMQSMNSLAGQEVDRKNVNEELKSKYKQGIASMAGTGAAIGTAVMPGIGTAVGAAIGALAGSYM
ncbi:DUF1269 domain-containing protein [Vibrio fluvialis]|uniref:DUF1269 domain-containing protein n=1 Tax=Vibrio fluvialis TaxID=676 RepID=UPI001EECC255|nr:DUF1269 domain-containing protein [Vibrio fluvialis]MCG6405288.1 DUF1269 domain-containing protein [Vibrio fluvialis]